MNPSTYECDVLTIGGGIASTMAAIKAREHGAEHVILVDKAYAGKSGCSVFAAGVLNIFFPEWDDYDAWFKEIVELNSYLCDQEWLAIHLREISGYVKELEEWGVEFEKTPDGKFVRVLSRGSHPGSPLRNIMFHGPQLMHTVRKKTIQSGVKVHDRIMITDLLTSNNRVVGAVGFNAITGEFVAYKAKATVMAAGSVMYKTFGLAHKTQTGDGNAIVYRAGGELTHYELTIRNVLWRDYDVMGMNMFVGLGGKFVNAKGEEFMNDYDQIYGNRAPLYKLYCAMAFEVKQGRGPIYIDTTHWTPEQVRMYKTALPLSAKILERTGVLRGNKMTRKMEWVPYTPSTTACGGGVKINTSCETNLPGLYAAGDVAAKMIATIFDSGGGAFPWAITTGARAGRFAAEYALKIGSVDVDEQQVAELRKRTFAPLERKDGIEPDHVLLLIQEAITPYEATILTDVSRLEKALAEVERIRDSELPRVFAYDPHYLRSAHEVINMTLCAEMFLRAALLRKESRGPTLREDYPELDNENWLKYVIVKKEGGEMRFRTEDLPIDRYPLKPKREKVEHPLFGVAKRRQ